jgi:hypothetical protein
MKRKRLLLIFACVAALLLAGYLALRLTAQRHRITLENTRAIEKGMSESEVEGILGVRAGDYSSNKPGGTFLYHQEAVTGIDLVRMRGGKFWASDETSVWLRFDDAGRVAEVFCGSYYEQESLLDKIRDWLGM